MLTVLICFGIGLIIGLISCRKKEVSDALIAPLLFGALTGFLIAVVLSGGNLGEKDGELRAVKTESIVSIEDDSRIDGHFVLGFGIVKEGLCFTFYRGNNDSGYVFDYIEAARAKVVERDGIPRIEYRGWVRKGSIWKSFVIYPPTHEIIICVPKGTIVKTFNLDSKI